jgi:hypothetical protein
MLKKSGGPSHHCKHKPFEHLMAVPLHELTCTHTANWSRAAPPAALHRPSSRRRCSARRLCASGAEAPVALILEAEGVLLDHHAVHRQAFNDAFSEYGLDCANWTAPVSAGADVRRAHQTRALRGVTCTRAAGATPHA